MGLILDVGCGGNPIPQADVTCDRYFNSEDQEHDHSNIQISGNFLICDLHYLPFLAKAFSHVNCTHVLEHVLDPQRGYSELRRVSEHGYIETPSSIYENLLFGWRGHLWYFFKKGGRVFFKPVKRLMLKNLIILPIGWMTRRPGPRRISPKQGPIINRIQLFNISHSW